MRADFVDNENISPFYTAKILDNIALGLQERTRLHVYEGTVRSSKSVTATQELYYSVLSSREELHLIAANNLDAVKDNILYSEFGLLKLYGDTCSLAKDKIGSYHIKLFDNSGKEKKILLAGYSDIAKWKNILGKTFGVILVDEVNTANKQFIDECFARQVSVDHPLMIWTLNGDNPQHWIYTDYINRANIIGEAPSTIVADMAQYRKEAGWYYTHWTMHDNPIMTPTKIEKAYTIYPKGSYYYTIKMLGERGVPGELIYLDYLTNEHLVDAYAQNDKKDLKYKLNRFIIGVDIGADAAHDAFSLLGITSNYEIAVVLDVESFKSVGYATKKIKLRSFVERSKAIIRDKFNYGLTGRIEGISVDGAEKNFINDLKAEYYNEGIPVFGYNKPTIKDRIDMNIVLLSQKRLLFNKTAEKAYRAFAVAKWEENHRGERREDNGEEHNDIIDSVEYAEIPHMRALMLARANS